MTSSNQARAKPEHVLITGASSGIGAALARAYAGPGMRLALFGRDEDRTRAVAEACRAKGALVAAILVNVTDRETMAQAVTLVDDAHPLDLVIANAGIAGTMLQSGDGTAHLFAVNVMGVVHTVEPLLPRLVQRGRGQVALMSSLASFVARPGAAAYCASKAAVRIWGEGLRERLLPHGVEVSVICPGFVDTPLTRKNPFPMPMLMTAEAAAALIKDRLARGDARIAFPKPVYWGARLAGLLPASLQQRLSGHWPGKE
ncbi:SDR family NAD(P)-dependent oxidoreductase [Benzoatithermus flavus]|uniref:SDR family NAD(P)-dependent oxidoreductase n=1 Tax=Benzoatithermus flavus TaxID=3108223 RepID=A0ABU8XQ00_9PROT